jgi:phospholipase/lecithinase/hemolysin
MGPSPSGRDDRINVRRRFVIVTKFFHGRIVHRALAVLALVLSLDATGIRAEAGDVTQIIAFGDSLSDVGNTYLAAGIPASPPYYNGHYSNGPIWLEYLANRLGIAAPTPSLAGGTDYAWGGAQTGDGLSVQGTPNTGFQIATFLASDTLNAGQLITLWAGANDFLNAGVTDPTVPLANIAAEITTLATAGGKMFMVPNLPLLGELPATNTLPSAQRQALDQLTLAFNSGLSTELNQLQSTLGIAIYQLDINSVFQQMIADPAAFGLTNVTDSALADGVLSGQGYLFWDIVHPTTQVQARIGDLAVAAAVPEPSSLTMMLGAGGMLVVFAGARVRRRNARRSGAQA